MQEIPSCSSYGDSWNFSMVCLHEQLDSKWTLRPPSITSVGLVVSHLVLALGPYLPYLQPRFYRPNNALLSSNLPHDYNENVGYYLCLLNPKIVHANWFSTCNATTIAR